MQALQQVIIDRNAAILKAGHEKRQADWVLLRLSQSEDQRRLAAMKAEVIRSKMSEV